MPVRLPSLRAAAAATAAPVAPHGAGWSLERKLPVLIAALLAAVVGAFGAAAYREVRLATVERASTRLAGVAQQLAAMAAANGGTRVAALRALAADPAVVAAAGEGAAAPLTARVADQLTGRLGAARRAGDSTVLAWELWTADGRRLRAGAARSPRDSAVLAATVRRAAASDSIGRSAFYQVGGHMAVWTVVPVLAADGRRAGVLAEGRRVATTPRREQMIRDLTGEDVEVLVTSRAAGAEPAEWATIGGAPREAPFALPRAGARGRALRLRDPAGVRHFVAAAAVPQTPWLIVLTEPEASVLRRPREFLHALLGAGALVLAAGAFAAWLLGRHVTRPLVAVTRAAEALADGDYGQRVAVAGGAELAALAATFNAMAAGVGEAHAALAERNAGLQRANAAKAQFLAMMSHELRTPLNAIGGYTELMALGIRGPVTPEQLADLARIRRSKDHLLSIITDLLSFARADAGHLTLALAPVALRDVLAEAETLLGPQFAAKGVRLQVAPAPPGAVARADREKLQQVVLNLLTNALRFTPAGGSAAVTCTLVPDGTVRIAVRDTGVGIPADRLDAIFEPFVQVDAALTRQVGGTGLGLAIVRTLVGAMGGQVGVDSIEGAGSTFRVTLPRADVPARAAGGAGPSAPARAPREAAVVAAPVLGAAATA
jgi:signal transduction histidine kinase